jgi:hypothetical protein
MRKGLLVELFTPTMPFTILIAFPASLPLTVFTFATVTSVAAGLELVSCPIVIWVSSYRSNVAVDAVALTADVPSTGAAKAMAPRPRRVMMIDFANNMFKLRYWL